MSAFIYKQAPVPPGFPPHDGVMRSDGAVIPADPRNSDWLEYEAWLEAGNALAKPEASPVNAVKATA